MEGWQRLARGADFIGLTAILELNPKFSRLPSAGDASHLKAFETLELAFATFDFIFFGIHVASYYILFLYKQVEIMYKINSHALTFETS